MVKSMASLVLLMISGMLSSLEMKRLIYRGVGRGASIPVAAAHHTGPCQFLIGQVSPTTGPLCKHCPLPVEYSSPPLNLVNAYSALPPGLSSVSVSSEKPSPSFGTSQIH